MHKQLNRSDSPRQHDDNRVTIEVEGHDVKKRNIMKRVLSLTAHRRGVAAMEFAVVGMIFITLTMFVMDTGLQLYTQSIVDDATRTAAHNIKTGYRTAASTTPVGARRGAATDVLNTVCGLLSKAATACTTSPQTTALQVYATSGTSFSVLRRKDNPATGLSSNNALGSGGSTAFSPGVSNSYVLLQVAILRVSVIPFSGITEPYVVSSVMFENEL